MTTEQKIIDVLEQHEPLTANEIARRLGKTAFEVRPKLQRLSGVLSHNNGVEPVFWLDDGNDAPGAA